MTRVRSEPSFFASSQAVSLSQAQLQADAWSSTFSQQATHFQTIASFAVAGLVGQAARGLFLGSGLVRNALLNPLFGHGFGLIAESAALTGLQAPSLLESEASSLHTFRSHLMNLTALKIGGSLFHHSPAWIRHFSTSAAMVGAHHLAVTFEWEIKNSRSLFEEMLEAELLTLQMETGNALGHQLTGHHFVRVQRHLARRAEFSQRLETHSRPRIFEYASTDANITDLSRVKYHPNFVSCWTTVPETIRLRTLRVIEGLVNGSLSKGHKKKKLTDMPLHQIKLSDQHRILFAPRGRRFELIHVGTHNEIDRVIRQWKAKPLQESQDSNGFDPFAHLRNDSPSSQAQSANTGEYVGYVLFADFWRRHEAEQSSADRAPEMIIEEAAPALSDPSEVLKGKIDAKFLAEFPELNTLSDDLDDLIVTLSENSPWRGDPDSRLYLHLQALRNRLNGVAREPNTVEALNEMGVIFDLAETKDHPEVVAGLALEAYRKIHPIDRLRLQKDTAHLERIDGTTLRTQALEFILRRELRMGDFDSFIEMSAALDPLTQIASWMIHSPRDYLKLKQKPALSRIEMYAHLIRTFPLCEFSSDFPLSEEELGFWNGSSQDFNTGLDVGAALEQSNKVYKDMALALSRNFVTREISEAQSLAEEWNAPPPGSREDMLTFWNEAPSNFRRVFRYYREILGESASQSKLAKVIRQIATLRRLGAPTAALENYAVHAFEHAAFMDDKVLKDGFEKYPRVLEWLERCPEVMAEPIATALPPRDTIDTRRFHGRNNRIAGAAFTRLLSHTETAHKISEALWRRAPEEELSDEQMDAWMADMHRFVARAYLKNRGFVAGRLNVEFEVNPLLNIEFTYRKLPEIGIDFPEIYRYQPKDILDLMALNEFARTLDPAEYACVVETRDPNGSFRIRILSAENEALFRRQKPGEAFQVDDETMRLGEVTHFRPFSISYRLVLLVENFLTPNVFRLMALCRRFENPFRVRSSKVINKAANLLMAGVPNPWAMILFYRHFLTEYCEEREAVVKQLQKQDSFFASRIFVQLPEHDLMGAFLETHLLQDADLANIAPLRHELRDIRDSFFKIKDGQPEFDFPATRITDDTITKLGLFMMKRRHFVLDHIGLQAPYANMMDKLWDELNPESTPELFKDSPSFSAAFNRMSLPQNVNRSGNFAHLYARAMTFMGMAQAHLPGLQTFLREVLPPINDQSGPACVLATLDYFLEHREEILAFVPENLQ